MINPNDRREEMKLVITQKGTIEGFTAGWVAKRILKDECEIVQLTETMPEFPSMKDRDVLIFGFSFSRNLVQTCIKAAKSFRIFDNDFKGKQELAGIKEAKINIKQTPARMAWEYLRGGVQVQVGPEKKSTFRFSSAPWIVDYSDDLKRWKWPGLNPFFIKIAIEKCYKRELEDWDELATRDIEGVISQGKEFIQKQEQENPQEESNGTGKPEAEESGVRDDGPATRKGKRRK